ncbi:MAG: SRPBCC domain-containing protein [Candidatus Tumulicola sp.]
MNLEWNGRETIPAAKSAVWAFVNDPAKIAACIPELTDVQIRDARSFDAKVPLEAGPVRGKIGLKVVLEPSADGNHIDIKISGGGLGSSVNLVAGADLAAESDAVTSLTWKSTASLRGPIAAAARMLNENVHWVIATTFENVTKHLSGGAA